MGGAVLEQAPPRPPGGSLRARWAAPQLRAAPPIVPASLRLRLCGGFAAGLRRLIKLGLRSPDGRRWGAVSMLRGWGLVLGFVGLGLVVGCASPPTDDEIKLQLRSASEGVRGLGRTPRLVVLNAQSKMEAWSHVAESAADGPSSRARAVGRNFKKGRRQRVGVVVGGPQSDYVDRFVRDAFESAGPDGLPGLTLLVVTPEPPSDWVRGAALKRGVKLVHRTFRR